MSSIETLSKAANRLPNTLTLLCSEVADKTAFLFASETQYISHAAYSRRCDFSTGRWLMREGLAKLGEPAKPILKGRLGEPIWPDGIIGSLSHSGSRCALVIGRSVDYMGVGIDVERSDTDIGDAADFILAAGEPSVYRSPSMLRTVFSAKESVYKCLYPICQAFLEFHEIAIEIDLKRNTFRAFTQTQKVPPGLVESGCGLFEKDKFGVITLFFIPRHITSPL